MPLVKVKPTSPGRRALVKAVNPDLHKGAPYAPLLTKQSKTNGRNNAGRITMRHKGGGHKQHYRLIDFKRNKDGIPAKVERLEYDPNRSANLALLLYVDGERRYVIAPKGVTPGTQLLSGIEAPIRPGNTLPLRNIPVGVALVEPDDLRVAAGLVAQLERARLARKLEYHCGDLCLRVAPGKYEAKPRGDKRRAMRQQGHVCLLNQAAVNCAFEGLDLSSNLAEAFPKLS